MIYYSLQSKFRLQRCVTEYPSIPVSFLNGKPFDPSTLDPILRVEGTFDAEVPPSHYETGVIPIFSDKLVAFFRSVGVDNIQTIPCVIRGRDGTEWSGYSAVQVIGLVECCDLDATDHEELAPGDGDSIPKLISANRVTIDPTRVPKDARLFRLAEDPSHLLAPHSVVEKLVEQSPDGGWGIACKAACDD